MHDAQWNASITQRLSRAQQFAEHQAPGVTIIAEPVGWATGVSELCIVHYASCIKGVT
jgi:hypothetical protein